MSRVTQSMLVSNYMINTNRNLRYMQTMQSQLSSGKEISRPSDDPYRVTRIMQLYTEIDSNNQFNENIKDTSNWLDATDTALDHVNNILARIRELQVSVGNPTYNDEERIAIQVEMKQKSEELVSVLNTNFDGVYIFGGEKSLSKPVSTDSNGIIKYADKDGNLVSDTILGGREAVKLELTNTEIKASGTLSIKSVTKNDTHTSIKLSDDSTPIVIVSAKDYQNLATADKQKLNDAGISENDFDDLMSRINSKQQIDSDLKVEVSQGVYLNYNITATDILEYGDGKNVMDVLNKIINNLEPTNTEITNLDGTTSKADSGKIYGELLTEVDLIISNLLNKRAEVGALSNRMELAEKNNKADNESMTEILSKTEDIDFTEKIMEYSVLQTVYSASLQVSGKVLPMTLLNYL